MSEKTIDTGKEFQTPPSVVSLKDVMHEAQKKAKGLNYYMNELVGKEIVIVKVDLSSNVCQAFLNDQLVTIGWKSNVITKKMALIDKIIRANFQGVRVKVVERVSKSSGKTYLDLE
ncbi:MAG: hypothetical protein JHC26_08990 [Thermofilum sp.]|jgi:hypothetical protein|uniref:hypothetical protein n=1 Tax=Thermofilum sp. TaxID=1961369 RepID=UPI002583E876|nr:hypothetical protein [Thermofilum sp.]MCI4409214.1 hypothetical protein [Thermofilum sp.]